MNIDTYKFHAGGSADNQNALTWSVWGILTFTLLILLILGIVWSIINYRKTNRSFLTVGKITIFASYLAFFLIQAFVTSPLLKLPIPFSIDSITTIAIGFIYGPLEGILFGWVADSLRVLLHGWTYQFLPSLMYPMIGLIAALFGILYKKYEELPNWSVVVIFQVAILSMVIIMVPLDMFLSAFGQAQLDPADKYLNNLNNAVIPVAIFATISLIMMEGMFASIYIFKLSKKDIVLILMLFMTAYADRIFELVIRPFTQYFTGYETVYLVSLYTRILSSTYLIPCVTIASWALVKTSLYTMGIISRD